MSKNFTSTGIHRRESCIRADGATGFAFPDFFKIPRNAFYRTLIQHAFLQLWIGKASKTMTLGALRRISIYFTQSTNSDRESSMLSHQSAVTSHQNRERHHYWQIYDTTGTITSPFTSAVTAALTLRCIGHRAGCSFCPPPVIRPRAH